MSLFPWEAISGFLPPEDIVHIPWLDVNHASCLGAALCLWPILYCISPYVPYLSTSIYLPTQEEGRFYLYTSMIIHAQYLLHPKSYPSSKTPFSDFFFETFRIIKQSMEPQEFLALFSTLETMHPV